jgi:hypothetical protein
MELFNGTRNDGLTLWVALRMIPGTLALALLADFIR